MNARLILVDSGGNEKGEMDLGPVPRVTNNVYVEFDPA